MNHVKHVIPMSDTSVSIKPEDIQPTVLPDAFIQSDMVRKLNALSLPRYDQLPNVTLYRDQVIEYVALWMEPLSICVEQPAITPSMINNYVKVGLVPAPVKKQYGREQIARLIVICIFKQVLPIAAIQALFNIQRLSYDAPTAFDYVVDSCGVFRRADSRARFRTSGYARVTARTQCGIVLRFEGVPDELPKVQWVS